MFWVVRDFRKWILGYAVTAPISKNLFDIVYQGEYSSLNDFPQREVLKTNASIYYYLEVIAGIPSKTISRAGTFMIRSVGEYLLHNAKHVLTSPISDIGIRLCKYFNFKHVSDEKLEDKVYPIYHLKVDKNNIVDKLKNF